jgi:hypothetical protein
MASISESTPEKYPKNPKENSEEKGEGVDAKKVVDSPANEIGDCKNLQVDKYGYQIIDIRKDRVKLTFPDGEEIRSPTDYIQKVLFKALNYEPATSK